MNILLFGPNGQVGWELQRSLSLLGNVDCIDRVRCDIASPASLHATLSQANADVIVNAAAYTAVDKAEAEPALCQSINAWAAETMARHASASDALLVHYSTDYVFDGSKAAPYAEIDATNPLSEYGRSKLAGELAIQASGCKHLIFRTSWVYSAHGGNFIKTILRLARTKTSLNVIDDQFGAPTSAELIADVTALAIRQARGGSLPSGLYHLTAAGSTNWHSLAQHVVHVATERNLSLALDAAHIQPVPTSGYPLPAKRPSNSILDTSKIRESLGIVLPQWQHQLDRTLEVLTSPA